MVNVSRIAIFLRFPASALFLGLALSACTPPSSRSDAPDDQGWGAASVYGTRGDNARFITDNARFEEEDVEPEIVVETQQPARRFVEAEREIVQEEEDVVVEVEDPADRVFFALDSSALSAAAQQVLRNQIAWLQAQPSAYAITIEGHADERGTREYNLALGARRAQSVRDFMVAGGIDPGRISTISYGKERPVETCSDESCWSVNRRAVTKLR